MRLAFFAGLAGLMLAGTGAAADNMLLCGSPAARPVDAAAACSDVIEEGLLKGHTLAAAYYNRGVSWFRRQDNGKAIADYSEAIRIDPAYGSAYLNRGIAYGQVHRTEEAMADLRRAEALGAKDSNLRTRAQSAIRQFRRAEALNRRIDAREAYRRGIDDMFDAPTTR